MKNLEEVVVEYMKSTGQDLEELHDVRVIEAPGVEEDSPLVYHLELVCGNEWVRYTKVVKVNLVPLRFKTVTARTRLWVPFSEVPHGCEFYQGQDGPLVVHSDEALVLELFKPWNIVEVEFFYSRREGVIAGGQVIATTEELDAAGYYVPELVQGCKFDFWAVCHNLQPQNGGISVYTHEDAK